MEKEFTAETEVMGPLVADTCQYQFPFPRDKVVGPDAEVPVTIIVVLTTFNDRLASLATLMVTLLVPE